MLSFWHQILALLLIITLSHLKRLWKNSSNHKRHPPSPPKLPILGNLHQMSVLPHRSFHSLGSKHGPIMLLHFGNKPVIVIQSADAAREFLKAHDLAFADKAHTTTVRRLSYDLKDVIMAPYGECWRKLKSICVVQLLSGKRVQSFGVIREEEVGLVVKKIHGSCGSIVNLSECFDLLTHDFLCRAAFGRKFIEGEDGRKFMSLLKELMQLLGSGTIGDFVPWLSWINRVNGFHSRIERVARGVDLFLERVVEQHHGGDRENFVDILINVCKENSSGVPIDRTTIKAIILDMFAGGTDTTSATLEWAMTELQRHPTVLKKLQTQVREVMEDDRRDITDNDVGKMPYLKAIVKETLRFHPPLPVAHDDVRVMGFDVAAGTIIAVNAWKIGRDPACWDEPDKFKPERFINSSVEFKGLDFELIPFGTGRRGCPGIAFATTSIELVLANLAHKFEWGLPGGSRSEDLDTTEQPGATVHRKHPLLAVVTHSHLQTGTLYQ